LYNLERMREVIKRLEKNFPPNQSNQFTDAFSLLIATVLSQNTNDKNSTHAFQNLCAAYEITPAVLATLKPADIKPLIKYAGLQDVRSKRIIAISKIILQKFDGDLDHVLSLPLQKARATLLSLDGVGPKTVDILLNFLGGRAVMPIDTNIFRIMNRLNFVKGRNYEKTQSVLERLIPCDKLQKMHFMLIQFGRKICKPRKPECSICPLASLCPHPNTRDEITSER
jgi:endonuclease-3